MMAPMSRKRKRRKEATTALVSEQAKPAGALERARSTRAAVWLVLRTFGLMAVLYGAYYYPYPFGSWPDRLINVYLRVQTLLSGALIKVFDDTVRVEGTEIRGEYALQIVKDCSSLDAQALLLAAMLAFPAHWSRKLIGLSLGALVIVAANLVRIASLYFVGARAPRSFDAVHEELMPLLLVVIACVCFGLWTAWVQRTRTAI